MPLLEWYGIANKLPYALQFEYLRTVNIKILKLPTRTRNYMLKLLNHFSFFLSQTFVSKLKLFVFRK